MGQANFDWHGEDRLPMQKVYSERKTDIAGSEVNNQITHNIFNLNADGSPTLPVYLWFLIVNLPFATGGKGD